MIDNKKQFDELLYWCHELEEALRILQAAPDCAQTEKFEFALEDLEDLEYQIRQELLAYDKINPLD